jgi:protein-ribulosamine 3-kinase
MIVAGDYNEITEAASAPTARLSSANFLISMHIWTNIGQQISTVSGAEFNPNQALALGGGCINKAVKLTDGQRSYFVKLNQAEQLEMFAAEAAGLSELQTSATLRVPRPLCHGVAQRQAYLVMEYIDMGGMPRDAGAQAGRQLAALHRVSQPAFGWHRANTIGSTVQENTADDDWLTFWRERRLGFQLTLAARNGYAKELASKGEKLMQRLPALLCHHPRPALLHGDLWSGNMDYDKEGCAVIFDPAVYYGDREADIAMSELFGGFSRQFYAAYREAWPLPPGYEVRKILYNLYHILNHLNLFGGGYLHQARDMIDRLLAETG